MSGQTPSATTVAQKLLERTIAAHAIVAALDADQHKAALLATRYERESQTYYLTYQGSSATPYELVIAPGGATCSCPDRWGRTWLGACKHMIAFSVVCRRKRQLLNDTPHDPVARRDVEARHGLVLRVG